VVHKKLKNFLFKVSFYSGKKVNNGK